MRSRVFWLSSYLLITLGLFSCSNKENIFSFVLTSVDNHTYTFEDFKDFKAHVFVFVYPDCPITKKEMLYINNVYESHHQDSITFYGIIPGTNYSNETVLSFSNDYQIMFPLINDKNFAITKQLGATVAPQAVVINRQGKISYSGLINNLFEDLGKERKNVTEFYLDDAISSILSGQSVTIKKTEPVGCYLFGVDHD